MQPQWSVQGIGNPLLDAPKEPSRWELSLSRGRPFGDDGWTAQMVKALGLEHTVRGEGGNQYAEKGGK